MSNIAKTQSLLFQFPWSGLLYQQVRSLFHPCIESNTIITPPKLMWTVVSSENLARLILVAYLHILRHDKEIFGPRQASFFGKILRLISLLDDHYPIQALLHIHTSTDHLISTCVTKSTLQVGPMSPFTMIGSSTKEKNEKSVKWQDRWRKGAERRTAQNHCAYHRIVPKRVLKLEAERPDHQKYCHDTCTRSQRRVLENPLVARTHSIDLKNPIKQWMRRIIIEKMLFDIDWDVVSLLTIKKETFTNDTINDNMILARRILWALDERFRLLMLVSFVCEISINLAFYFLKYVLFKMALLG